MRYISAKAMDESSVRTISTSIETEDGRSFSASATSRKVRAPYLRANDCACSRVVTPRLTTHSPLSTRPRVELHSTQRTSATLVARNTAAARRDSSTPAYAGFMLSETRTRWMRMGPTCAAPRRAMSAANSSTISSTTSSADTLAVGLTRWPSTALRCGAGCLREWMDAAAGISPGSSLAGGACARRRKASRNVMAHLRNRTSRAASGQARGWRAASAARADRWRRAGGPAVGGEDLRHRELHAVRLGGGPGDLARQLESLGAPAAVVSAGELIGRGAGGLQVAGGERAPSQLGQRGLRVAL